jgi:uncharacterized protein YidB (DUF937 family)
MGLLDSVFRGGAPRGRQPGLGDTIAAGAVLALLVKAVRDHQAKAGGSAASEGQQGGLGGMLGGAGPAGGLGAMVTALGGAGVIGALINRFRQMGLGPQVDSWVGNGPNQPIAPHEVGHALGDETLMELETQSGLPRDQLLQELSKELPQAIDAATPNGRPPQDHELTQSIH